MLKEQDLALEKEINEELAIMSNQDKGPETYDNDQIGEDCVSQEQGITQQTEFVATTQNQLDIENTSLRNDIEVTTQKLFQNEFKRIWNS